jgi:hypothetical protein
LTDGIDVAPIAITLVGCTVLAAPVLLVAGSFSNGTGGSAGFDSGLHWVLWLNLPSMLGAVTLAASIFANKMRNRRFKYRRFAHLCLAQFLYHLSLMICTNSNGCGERQRRGLYFFQMVGDLAGTFWIVAVAGSVTVSTLYGRNTSSAMERRLRVLCWGIPVLVSLALTLAASTDMQSGGSSSSSNSQMCFALYPKAETYVRLVLNVFAIVACIGCFYGLKKTIVRRLSSKNMLLSPENSPRSHNFSEESTRSLRYGLLDSADRPTPGKVVQGPEGGQRSGDSEEGGGGERGTDHGDNYFFHAIDDGTTTGEVAMDEEDAIAGGAAAAAAAAAAAVALQSSTTTATTAATTPSPRQSREYRFSRAPSTSMSTYDDDEDEMDDTSMGTTFGYRFLTAIYFKIFTCFVAACCSIWYIYQINTDSGDASYRDVLTFVDVTMKSLTGLLFILIFGLEANHPLRAMWRSITLRCNVEEAGWSFLPSREG